MEFGGRKLDDSDGVVGGKKTHFVGYRGETFRCRSRRRSVGRSEGTAFG
jgi:hypothetical protein